jgi:hypothetical protein
VEECATVKDEVGGLGKLLSSFSHKSNIKGKRKRDIFIE